MELESTAQKLTLLLGKAESDLTTLAYKIDQEYKTLSKGGTQPNQVPSELIQNVQSLRAELKQVASDVQEIQKQQMEVQSNIQSMLEIVCGQYDELSGIVDTAEEGQSS